MNSLSEHIILVFMLKLFVSVLEHLCIHDNVHFHIASSHVITQIEYLLVLFSMFASPNILNSRTNFLGEQNYIGVVYKNYKNNPNMTSLSVSKFKKNSQTDYEHMNFWACWPNVTSCSCCFKLLYRDKNYDFSYSKLVRHLNQSFFHFRADEFRRSSC